MAKSESGSDPKRELRIIAGRYKNKKILLPDLQTTRSSKAMLREALFSSLQSDVVDSVFVEVFGGSGSIGLEALSRGAREAYFVEKDRKSFLTLQHNAGNIDAANSHCIHGNCFEEVLRLFDVLKAEQKSVIFYFDPPFSIREGMEDIYDRTFALASNVPGDIAKMLVFEHMTSLKMPEQIGQYQKQKSRKYGKSSLSYYINPNC